MYPRPFSLVLLSGLLASVCSVAQPNWDLNFERNTGGKLSYQGNEVCSLRVGLFYPGWSGTSLNAFDTKRLDEAGLHGKTTHRDVTFTSDLILERLSEQRQGLHYTLGTQEAVTLNSYYVGFTFPASVLRGQSYQVDDAPAKAFPNSLEGTRIESGAIRSLRIHTIYGPLLFSFRQPLYVLLQDNRQWSDTFTIRAGSDSEEKRWQAGESLAVDIELQFPAPYELQQPEVTVINAGEEWTPLETVLGIKEGSALDFSSMSYFDAPAGKHGRLKAVGKHFEFDQLPGRAQRFYGINFCGTGQVNPHEQAAALAERLHRLGYNSVRFHHHENSIIDRKDGQSTRLNAEAMDKLDFFFAELKKRGIYASTDMYVSRVVYASEIWPGASGNVDMREFKHLIAVHPAALANWKEFTRNFLLHKNPYTGMTYAEDPAMAWLAMINEATLSVAVVDGREERVKKHWLDAWNVWLVRKYGSSQARNQAWELNLPEQLSSLQPKNASARCERDIAMFLLETQNAMFAEMKSFIRDELGCQALLTDMNHGGNPAWAQLARNNFDYVDDHFYIDHPRFLERRWNLPSYSPNQSVIAGGSIGGDRNSYTRLLDKPFTITEFNYSAPGRYRGIGGILTGCLGALQDWAGIWRFAYAHSNNAIFEPGVINYFDMARDPLSQAAERAMICLYLRQDMLPASKSIAITLHPDQLLDQLERPRNSLTPAWRELNVLAQVGVFIGDSHSTVPADLSMAISDKAPRAAKNFTGDVLNREGKETLNNWLQEAKWRSAQSQFNDLSRSPMPRQSLNKQLSIAPAEDTMILDTARTAGGFAPAGASINTAAARITVLDTDATVWASALDERPLQESAHILITHLTDLQNTEARFAEKERQNLMAWGKLPHLMRNGRAEVLIRTTRSELPKAWALRTNGERLAPVPVSKGDAGIELKLSVKGEQGAQFIYELSWE
jgi:hypothetical protein